MKMLFVALACASMVWGEVDARDLVRKSVANYQRDYHAILNYSYTERDVETKANGQTVSVSEVFNLNGTPYERLISKNGRPLTASEQRKEKEKYEKAIAERSRETPAQRHKRLADYDKQRSFLKEVPEALNFKILGEQSVNGRPAYVVECTPNPAYQPRTSYARIFSKIEAKLWIDKQDVQWAKAEAHVTDTISFGVILARVAKGAHITIEQTRLADNLWVPKQFDITGNARVMVVKNRNLNEQITYSGYRAAKPVEGSPAKTASLNDVTPAGR